MTRLPIATAIRETAMPGVSRTWAVTCCVPTVGPSLHHAVARPVVELRVVTVVVVPPIARALSPAITPLPAGILQRMATSDAVDPSARPPSTVRACGSGSPEAALWAVPTRTICCTGETDGD